jgi:hypothetical protein
MIWIITIYLFGSTAIAVSTGISAGFLAGLSALGTGFLAVIAAAGLKFGILRGNRQQLLGIGLAAVAVLATCYWLSLNFSVQLFGTHMSGLEWGCIGATVGFICITKQMASG